MVFQNYALFPHLNVAQNITFGLDVRRVPKAERTRRLNEASALLGLDAYLLRKPAELSGGQRQRVALGRAIVAQAPVCLMDEPLSNLDAKLRQQMRSEIRELQQRLGMTMIYVTHDQTEAMTMSDRVALLNQGVVAQCDTPQALYEQPANTFVASFIGAPAMNLYTPLDASQAHEVHGVRPEKVRLLPPDQGLPARVKAVEYLGAETLVSCEWAEQTERAALMARLPSGESASVGDHVGLHWAPSHVHRFDRASGQRLGGRFDD
jgi:sn-glycerol 3-phosphate transport system ATP-binding protein